MRTATATVGADTKFAAWMAAVNRSVERKVGLSVYDLSDLPFRDLFERKTRPAEAARMALAESGYN